MGLEDTLGAIEASGKCSKAYASSDRATRRDPRFRSSEFNNR